LAEVFQIQEAYASRIESAVIVPVMDPTTGKIVGTMNLFRTNPSLITQETLDIVKEVTFLASLALSRATVLEKALALATSDELTGLTNRRGFYDRFEAEIERARRNPSSLCVAIIDLDHFKKLNDTYGHLSGDIVLKTLARLFDKNVRKSDLVCRFGGEEFVLLLPDTTLKSAEDLINRIRTKVEKLTIKGNSGEPIHVTLSAGLAQVNTINELHRPVQEVISDALAISDQQLYLAKDKGRNQICATCK
jgi:diguanylate cyclase (GGDEF)-like protein